MTPVEIPPRQDAISRAIRQDLEATRANGRPDRVLQFGFGTCRKHSPCQERSGTDPRSPREPNASPDQIRDGHPGHGPLDQNIATLRLRLPSDVLWRGPRHRHRRNRSTAPALAVGRPTAGTRGPTADRERSATGTKQAGSGLSESELRPNGRRRWCEPIGRPSVSAAHPNQGNGAHPVPFH